LGYKTLLSNTTGNDNTAAGQLSMQANVSGSYNTGYGGFTLYNTTASGNTACGYYSLYSNAGGADHTGVGLDCLQSKFSKL
jgi:hypothetical protein